MNRLAVTKWADDPAAPVVTCHKCGGSFRSVALRDGVRCGRDRCPHCRELRRVPGELHETYTQWFGLVTRAVAAAGRKGVPEDVAETACHVAYVEALLRWVPERGAFSTVASMRISTAVRQVMRRRAAVPASHQLDGDLRDMRTADHDTAAVNGIDAAEQVAALLPHLPERERAIVAARFGIGGPAQTLAEIGRTHNLSKERVRQLADRALAKLQRLAGAKPCNSD